MSHVFLLILLGIVVKVFTGHKIAHFLGWADLFLVLFCAVALDGARFLSWFRRVE